VSRIVTDYSQMPKLNPVAPQHEEPWLRLPPRRVLLLVLWSWFNDLWLLTILMSESKLLIRPSWCGTCNNFARSQVFVVAPTLIGLNLAIWAIANHVFPRRTHWPKRSALLAIIVWCGVVGAIYVGRMLPVDGDPRTIPTHQNNRL